MLVATAVGAFLLSVIVTRSMRSLALRRHLLDHPNERSAHTAPTPRLGGVGIISSFLAATAAVLWVMREAVTLEILAVLAGTASMAALGLADDLRPIPARWRLIGQLCAATFVVATVGADVPERLGSIGRLLPVAVAVPMAILWIVWVTNLYNFMDGINGIAGSQAILACGAVASVGFGLGSAFVAWMAVFLASATAGFLLFNFPRASIFMGDVGSTAIGFFLASVSLIAAPTGIPFEVAALAISLFVLDATATLLRRIVRRERWFEAHRSHFYQRPLAQGVSHAPITLVASAGMLVVAVGAAVYPFVSPGGKIAALALPIVMFGSLAGLVMRLERQRSRR